MGHRDISFILYQSFSTSHKTLWFVSQTICDDCRLLETGSRRALMGWLGAAPLSCSTRWRRRVPGIDIVTFEWAPDVDQVTGFARPSRSRSIYSWLSTLAPLLLDAQCSSTGKRSEERKSMIWMNRDWRMTRRENETSRMNRMNAITETLTSDKGSPSIPVCLSLR